MIIDSLTIAGFATAASFVLMPFFMRREFIRVETLDEPQASTLGKCQGQPASQPGSLRTGSIKTA
jgi:hypothetical protein